jgi:TusA-related sulfurtransferase
MKHALDLRGMISPFTALKLSNGFRKMEAGEILEVVGTSSDSGKSIQEVLATLPCEVLGIQRGKDGYLIRIRKLNSAEAKRQGMQNASRPV